MKRLSVIILLIYICVCEAFLTKFNWNLKPLSAEEKISASNYPHSRQRLNRIERNLVYIQEQELESSYWINEAQKKLKAQLERRNNVNIAKNIIIMLGDGMSFSTITAARIHAGQMQHKSGEENLLSFEQFPHVALSKTYCVNMQVADSACTATAYLGGVKGNYQTIGVNGKVELNDCMASLDEENQVNSILKWAQDAGKATGIVTTTRVTHASPAGTYAHTSNRDWESDFDMFNFNDTNGCKDIALQLITDEPGRNFNVIYGGGRKKFISDKIIDESGSRGERLDGRDLIDEWLEDKKLNSNSNAAYIHNREGLLSMNHSDVDHVLGLFADSHLDYNLNNKIDQPTLKEMTLSAIEILSKNENGYVIFVEGGRIDHGHHDNQARYALDETVQFAEAIQSVVDITDERDTLIVTTADHAHTMTMSGYSNRGSDILGINTEISDVDKMPYLTLSYANGPSGSFGRQNPNHFESEMGKDDFQYPSLVPMEFETHGGEDVAVYARGPYSHLFDGVLEQNTIPHFIAYAACIGNGLTACDT